MRSLVLLSIILVVFFVLVFGYILYFEESSATRTYFLATVPIGILFFYLCGKNKNIVRKNTHLHQWFEANKCKLVYVIVFFIITVILLYFKLIGN